MRTISGVIAGAVAAFLAGVIPAQAALTAKVDLNSQSMNVYVDGKLKHSWSIPSGRRGFETPIGNYRPQRLEREWYSRQYDDAPMPYSVFFHAGYAIHGGYGRMGRPASHGCIRLPTAQAATFYKLVEAHGARNTRIEIDD